MPKTKLNVKKEEEKVAEVKEGIREIAESDRRSGDKRGSPRAELAHRDILAFPGAPH